MLNLRYPRMNYFNNPITRVAAVYMLLNAAPGVELVRVVYTKKKKTSTRRGYTSNLASVN